MSYAWIYFTCADVKDARKIVALLLKKRVVACANILAACESHYVWQGKLTQSAELPVLCKTRASLVKKAIQIIKKAHSYDCPGITSVKVQRGAGDFLKWIKASTES